jgi:hypothetical protein
MFAGDLERDVQSLRWKTMMEKHIHPHRGWALIRDGGVLTREEFKHLEYCHACHDWLVTFVTLARKAGFHITFEVPQYALLRRSPDPNHEQPRAPDTDYRPGS